MSKIKWFLQHIKKKLTPLNSLPRELKYNPFVDNSEYIKDLIWEYRPLISIGDVSIHTTHLGSEVWELIAPGLKYPICNFSKSKIRTAFWAASKYDLVDYQFDIFFNGILLFRLRPIV